MKRMLPMAFDKFPGGPVIEAARQAHYLPAAVDLKESLVGCVASSLGAPGGVVIVLLIACANIANLMLVVRKTGSEKWRCDLRHGRHRVADGLGVPHGGPGAQPARRRSRTGGRCMAGLRAS